MEKMMFWISRKNFASLLEEAYQKGESGSGDLDLEVLQDLLLKAKPGKLNFKMQTIAQLQKIQLGRRIIHPLVGEGEITMKEGKWIAIFATRIEAIDQDNSEFWSYPISLCPTNQRS